MHLHSKSRVIFVLLAIALAMAGIFVAQASSSPTTSSVVSLPVVQTSVKSQAVTATRVVEATNSQSPDFASTIEKLLSTHPARGIRELYGLMQRGEVRGGIAAWDPNQQAAFGLEFGKDIKSDGSPSPVVLYPVIQFSAGLLIDAPNNRARWIHAQLVVYHEFVHYLQWKEKRSPEDGFIMIRSPEEVHDVSAQVCADKWQNELEAYSGTCEFARAAELLDQLDRTDPLLELCLVSQDEVERRLLSILSRDPFWSRCQAF